MSKQLKPVQAIMASLLNSPIANTILSAALSSVTGAAVKFSDILANVDKNNLPGRFERLLQSLAGPNGLTLIIDEANIAFNVTKKNDVDLAKRTLSLFTALTKQDKLVRTVRYM